MAEIHVQTKKNTNAIPSWVWILIGLIIAAAVIYFVTRDKDVVPDNKTPANPTSQVEWQYSLAEVNA